MVSVKSDMKGLPAILFHVFFPYFQLQFPFPGRVDDELQIIMPGLPAGKPAESGAVGNHSRRITGAPGRFLDGKVSTRYLPGGSNNLSH